jgi:hypothetical protein
MTTINISEEKTKKCVKCGEIKLLSEYYKKECNSDGLFHYCKKCACLQSSKWHKDNAERIRFLARENRLKNIEKHRERDRNWSRNNPEKIRAKQKRKRKKFPEKCKAIYEKWKAKKDPEYFRSYRNEYSKKRRGTPRGKLNENISTRMYQFLKSAKQNKHWEEFVPYTLDDLKLHLEKQFDEKMNWENYGLYWEVDHKIPISVFNFECPQDIDFGKCWSLENLRPLEKSKNRAKRNTLEEPFQPSLMLRF